jgi:hypothetical protein
MHLVTLDLLHRSVSIRESSFPNIISLFSDSVNGRQWIRCYARLENDRDRVCHAVQRFPLEFVLHNSCYRL